MKHASDRLGIYEDMLECSRAMRESAQQQEWDTLIQQRARYVDDVEALQRMPQDGRLNAQERQYCARMIEEILEHDRAIRAQLDARCEELTQLMGSSRRQQALVRAYNQGQGTLSQRTRPSRGSEGRT
ncbi:flagellar protein FliT [Chromohalobacter marismortui]|uniref:Flagellar protein FliT n=1 Tax=Chromohalobacter marismortui TaxID=42055 RepID=A0A4R7NQI3_9GAMM|nr:MULTISPECIES: flagellar protein FliT [Chromohalobacter]MCI0508784.1 flagellar protein FliT [Chromohalobacter sp.]MCI0594571.1 flagellar protein FliT [Chromohalobacter sp.]TDU22849.1 flagellar protein FliT [Chromohalobacter marismortui]